jgi:membrane associated rhomboid family serine protease
MPEQPCAFHPDRLTAVSCSKCGRPICPEDMFEAPVGIHCPICAGKMREGTFGRTGYRVRSTAERSPLARSLARAQVTSLILAANVSVFALMLATGAPTSGRTLLRFGALPGRLPASQWWRLITATFVHIGFAHIAFNMFALILFSGSIEQRYGKARFAALYLGSGVLGSASSLAFSHSTISAGASGAIFGILGAWLAIALIHRGAPGMSGQLRSLLFLIGINVYIGIATPGIDLHAHLGGLAGGFAIATAIELSLRVRGRARVMVQAGGYLAVAIVAYLLTAAHVV